MSRLSFLLGVTLLVVAGTLIFLVTFERPESPQLAGAGEEAKPPRGSTSARSTRPVGNSHDSHSATARSGSGAELGLDPAVTATLDPARRNEVDSILRLTERAARRELDRLTRRYDLTPQQQDGIYPLIIAHHEQAHPAMTVGGQFLPAVAAGTTFEDSLASVLDPAQQDALVEATLDDEAWWKEIVGQLEDDLDAAIDQGEMVPAPEENIPAPAQPDTPAQPEPPAPGEGQASEHGGGNLFDLLGR